MSKAIVFNDLLSASDRQRVENLLKQSGFDPIFDPALPVSSIDLTADIGVVCLPIDTAEADAVKKRIGEFTAAGARVVAIWLDENAEDVLPAGIEGLGSAAISIGSPRAEKALAGEAIWESPKGALRPKKPMKRNC
jgi:hypothetical protein